VRAFAPAGLPRKADRSSGRRDAWAQIFADRPCSGVSHPKEFAKLQPLEPIADPCKSMILIDDLATSGWHVEESLTALRGLGASASAFVWITGAVT
jgi:hypothetical protein